MLVTVTGASGHIGGNLIRALLAENRPGLRLRALALHGGERTLAELPEEARARVEIMRGDLCDPEFAARAIAGSEVVYHLAAVISLEARDAARMTRVNLDATRNVLAACVSADVRRLVYFSSIHAFSTWPRDKICDETAELSDGDPDAPAYDRSKAKALRAVREAAAAGLDAVCVHPTGVIGPHDYRPSAMGSVIRDLVRGTLPALIKPGGFNFVDVRDVVAGAMAAEQRGKKGESYLLAGGWISVADLAGVVARVSGARLPFLTSPMWLARASAPLVVAASRMIGKPSPFTPASLHALRTHRNISHEKAARELGYSPRPVERSFEETVVWMRESGTFT